MLEATFIIEVSPAFLAQTGHHPSDIYDFFERHGFVPRVGLKGKASQYDEVFSRPEHSR
jgi:hypothetical protein